MKDLAPGPMEDFCQQHGIGLPFDVERIRAGRNSEVSRIHNRDGQWILKHYYQNAGDPRDRLGTEFGFLRFLQDAGVSGVPAPLAADHGLQLGLYSFLPGSRPQSITSDHISQAVDFIVRINRPGEISGLAAASDACVSWQDHLDLAENRLVRLLHGLPATPLADEVREFVATQLWPCWTRLEEGLRRETAPSTRAAELSRRDQILSPSDFGFHNALVNDGAVYFVDFEYAGWDDPAKLICDFMCQPEIPVTASLGRQFMEDLVVHCPHPDAVRQRAQLLLPVHRLKWCCILLNEFRREDRERRLHAGGVGAGVSLADQLDKSRQYFAAHLAAPN